MAPNRIYQEMGKLDLSEKPRLVEDIWDSITRSKAELPLPESQKTRLDKIHKGYSSGELILPEWKDAQTRPE